MAQRRIGQEQIASMAEGPGGSIYVTALHIQQMKARQGSGVGQTQLFRFKPA